MKYLILGLLFIIGCTYHTTNEIQKEEEEGDTGIMSTPGKSVSGGWSASGVLLGIGPLALTPSRDRQVSLQVEFPEARNYTIQFKISPTGRTVGSLPEVRALAIIDWSVEGNTVRRKIHIKEGQSITGTGQAVRVVVVDDSLAAFIVGNEPNYLVQILVAPGTRPTIENPPQLEPEIAVVTIPAAGNHVFTVPVDAGINSVAITCASTAGAPLPDQSVQVQQRDLVGPLKWYDPRQYFWVPVSSGTVTIKVINNSGAEIQVQITYGIDG